MQFLLHLLLDLVEPAPDSTQPYACGSNSLRQSFWPNNKKGDYSYDEEFGESYIEHSGAIYL